MKIVKEYRWEMGHRLRFHDGVCRNLHGHSYKLSIELTGKQNETGMLIDFYELDKIVSPIISKFDHAFFAAEEDVELIKALKSLDSNVIIKDFEPTAENLSCYFADKFSDSHFPANIEQIRVRIYESEESFAETEINFEKNKL